MRNIKNSNELIEFLKISTILKFPLIVLVVFIHIVHENITPVKLDLSAANLYHLIYNLISQNIGRVAVPCFFLFSGFLFFFKIKDYFTVELYKKQIKNRFKTLFIPYILWNCIYIYWLL